MGDMDEDVEVVGKDGESEDMETAELGGEAELFEEDVFSEAVVDEEL